MFGADMNISIPMIKITENYYICGFLDNARKFLIKLHIWGKISFIRRYTHPIMKCCGYVFFSQEYLC